MNMLSITGAILRLNSLIDSGKHSEISIDQVYDAINKRDIFEFIKNETGRELFIDIDTTTKDREDYLCYLVSLHDAYAGDHREKWGVKNSGLCLLLAWTNEILQTHFAKTY